MRHRVPSIFAIATALGLAATWSLTWAGALPSGYAPAQLQTSHVVAELAAAAALLLGATLSLRAHRAHWTLAAGLGALAYATLNVMSDFAENPAMLVTLGLTLALTLVALVYAFGTSEIEDGGMAR